MLAVTIEKIGFNLNQIELEVMTNNIWFAGIKLGLKFFSSHIFIHKAFESIKNGTEKNRS